MGKYLKDGVVPSHKEHGPHAEAISETISPFFVAQYPQGLHLPLGTKHPSGSPLIMLISVIGCSLANCPISIGSLCQSADSHPNHFMSRLSFLLTYESRTQV